jgi:cytochrome c-type biogenesis protein CcmH/NrfG
MTTMTMLRGKWALFGLLLISVAAGTWFFLRASSRTGAPATGARKPVAENPAHELQELTVELQKKPGHPPILMRMAQIEHDEGKLADAEGHLQQAVQTEPSNADAHVELGRILYEKGDWAGALVETQKALAINPKHVDALYNLGAIYANGGDQGRARSAWNEALSVAPQSDSGKKARDGLAKLAAGAKR